MNNINEEVSSAPTCDKLIEACALVDDDTKRPILQKAEWENAFKSGVSDVFAQDFFVCPGILNQYTAETSLVTFKDLVLKIVTTFIQEPVPINSLELVVPYLNRVFSTLSPQGKELVDKQEYEANCQKEMEKKGAHVPIGESEVQPSQGAGNTYDGEHPGFHVYTQFVDYRKNHLKTSRISEFYKMWAAMSDEDKEELYRDIEILKVHMILCSPLVTPKDLEEAAPCYSDVNNNSNLASAKITSDLISCPLDSETFTHSRAYVNFELDDPNLRDLIELPDVNDDGIPEEEVTEIVPVSCPGLTLISGSISSSAWNAFRTQKIFKDIFSKGGHKLPNSNVISRMSLEYNCLADYIGVRMEANRPDIWNVTTISTNPLMQIIFKNYSKQFRVDAGFSCLLTNRDRKFMMHLLTASNQVNTFLKDVLANVDAKNLVMDEAVPVRYFSQFSATQFPRVKLNDDNARVINEVSVGMIKYIKQVSTDIKAYRMSFSRSYPCPNYTSYILMMVYKNYGLHKFENYHDGYCGDYMPCGSIRVHEGYSNVNWACTNMGPKEVNTNSVVITSRYSCTATDGKVLRWWMKAFYMDYSKIAKNKKKKYGGVYVEDVKKQYEYFNNHVKLVPGAIFLLPLTYVLDVLPKIKCEMNFCQAPPGIMQSAVVMLKDGVPMRNHFNYAGYLMHYRDKFLIQLAMNTHFCTYSHKMDEWQFQVMESAFKSEFAYLKLILSENLSRILKMENKKLDYRPMLTTPSDKQENANKIDHFAQMAPAMKVAFQNILPEMTDEEAKVDFHSFLNEGSLKLKKFGFEEPKIKLN